MSKIETEFRTFPLPYKMTDGWANCLLTFSTKTYDLTCDINLATCARWSERLEPFRGLIKKKAP